MYFMEAYEREMGICSARGRNGQKASQLRNGATSTSIRSSTITSTTTNRSTAKANRSTTTTKTTTPTASGRPHSEADQVCRTQKTGDINGRGISET